MRSTTATLRDQWITHLLTHETDLLTRNRTRYLPNLPALIDYLNEITAGAPAPAPL